MALPPATVPKFQTSRRRNSRWRRCREKSFDAELLFFGLFSFFILLFSFKPSACKSAIISWTLRFGPLDLRSDDQCCALMWSCAAPLFSLTVYLLFKPSDLRSDDHYLVPFLFLCVLPFTVYRILFVSSLWIYPVAEIRSA